MLIPDDHTQQISGGPVVRLAHGKVCVLVSGVGGRDGGDDEATAAGRTDATLPDHPTDRRGR